MPSIPQSLLWISLVVLWLFVLVPMLISKRDAVRRTSDVALATRVLNSSARVRLRRRRGPAAGHRSDPDWQPSAGHRRRCRGRRRSRPVGGHGGHRRRPLAEGEPDYLDVDVVEDSGALPIADVAADDEQARGAGGCCRGRRADLGLQRRRRGGRRPGGPARRRSTEDTSRWVPADDEYEYVDDSSGLEEPSEADLRIASSISDRAAVAGSRRPPRRCRHASTGSVPAPSR